MRAFRFSLTFVILASLSFLLLLTWFLVTLISFKTAERDLFEQRRESARFLLRGVATVLGPEPNRPSEATDRLLDALATSPGFRGITVIDTRGQVVLVRGSIPSLDERLFSTLSGGGEVTFLNPGQSLLTTYLPLTDGESIVGAARLTISLAAEEQRLARSRHLFLAYFALDFILLLAVGGWILSRSIVRPVNQLLAVTEQIAAGELNQRLRVSGTLEIARLAESFNAMVERLRWQREEVARHVSSLEEANRQLKSAREETIRAEKMASVGVLAAGTAHEIGTPLAAIMGYSSLLQEELPAGSEAQDSARRINDEAGRIDCIMRGLLDYARPRPAEWSRFPLEQLVRETVELLTAQGALKGVHLEIEMERALPELFLDRNQLRQVLINLLINGRDAMPHGGTLTIHGVPLQGVKSSNWLQLDVVDTGTGIPSEHLHRIFDPFFTTKEPGKGTGLGLAITARIVESFGGRIEVKSSLGEGSRFTLTLPAAGEGGES